MREAIGGGWLLGFVVLFIVLFSSYLAISINYTRAFKTKNEIINIIETREGFTTGFSDSGFIYGDKTKAYSTEEEIYYMLKETAYFFTNDVNCRDGASEMEGGYCLLAIQPANSRGRYYKVTTFIKFELPIINFALLIPITGETKMIYYDRGIE